MKKYFNRMLGLAAAMATMGSSASNAKGEMNKLKNSVEQHPSVNENTSGYFHYPQPIFMPTKSQKIKNKVNRKRLGIKK